MQISSILSAVHNVTATEKIISYGHNGVVFHFRKFTLINLAISRSDPILNDCNDGMPEWKTCQLTDQIRTFPVVYVSLFLIGWVRSFILELNWVADSGSAGQDIPRFLWTSLFIFVFTSAHRWTVFYARWIQFTHSIFNITFILSYYLQVFWQNVCIQYSLPHDRYTTDLNISGSGTIIIFWNYYSCLLGCVAV